MNINSREIEFELGAEAAFSSLSPREQKAALNMLRIAQRDLTDVALSEIMYRIGNEVDGLYAIKLTPDLRMVIQRIGREIRLMDIINIQLAKRYFPKQLDEAV